MSPTTTKKRSTNLFLEDNRQRLNIAYSLESSGTFAHESALQLGIVFVAELGEYYR
jgi:hypothetical protein